MGPKILTPGSSSFSVCPQMREKRILSNCGFDLRTCSGPVRIVDLEITQIVGFPGNSDSHHPFPGQPLGGIPLDIIPPQLGTGAGTPSPRKLKAPSAMIINETISSA